MAKREWLLSTVFGGTVEGWYRGPDQFGKEQWTADQSQALVFPTRKAAQEALRNQRDRFMSGSLVIMERA